MQQLRGRIDKWDYMKLNIYAQQKKWFLNWRSHPHTEWEQIFARYTSHKGWITRINGAQKTKLPSQINDRIWKWANELNRAFSKEEAQMAKKSMRKVFTNLCHKGNANQNHTKIPPTVNGQEHHQGRGWIQVWHIWYIVSTFVNATVYPHPERQ
jgi:hypothetical protein